VLALKSADYAKIAEVASGDAALEAAFRMRPDLVLLDIMLPGMDGLSVCRALRSNPETAAVAVVMLTAKGADRDVVDGLDAGANDYIAKPFSKDVLLARIRAALRTSDAISRRYGTWTPIGAMVRTMTRTSDPSKVS